jgi:hypothetical protein
MASDVLPLLNGAPVAKTTSWPVARAATASRQAKRGAAWMRGNLGMSRVQRRSRAAGRPAVAVRVGAPRRTRLGFATEARGRPSPGTPEVSGSGVG